MRKFSKILASLLVAVMLLGVVLLSASAASDAENKLLLEGGNGIVPAKIHGSNVNAATTDFESGGVISLDSTGNMKNSTKVYAGAWGNKYARTWNDGTLGHTKSQNVYFDWRFARGDLDAQSVMNSAFWTYDFDLAADSFVINGFYTAPEGVGADSNGLAINTADDSAYCLSGSARIRFDALDDALIPGNYIAKGEDGYAVWTAAAVTAIFRENSGNIAAEGAKVTLADGSNILYDNLVLSYKAQNMDIGFRSYNNAESNTGDAQGLKAFYITYKESENQWYIKLGNSKEVALSRNVGEWNHISLVVVFDNTINVTKEDDTTETIPYDYALCSAIASGDYTSGYKSFTTNLGNSMAYFYFNGEFAVSTGVFTASSVDAVSDGAFKASVENLNNFRPVYVRHTFLGSNSLTKYSFGYDNVAVNWYVNDYAGELAQHIGTDHTQPLYNLHDVVYKSGYNSPAPTSPAGYISGDAAGLEVIGEYDLAVSAVDAAITSPTGAYATISSSVNNYSLPEGATVKSFFVKTLGEATFTLAEGTGYVVSDAPNADGYWVVNRSPKLEVFWFTDEETYLADCEDYLAKATLDVGDSLVSDKLTPEADKYIGNGKVYGYAGLGYAVESDSEITPVGVDSLFTMEMYDEAMEADGVLYVVPMYAERSVSYVIETASGVIYDETITTLVSEVAKLSGTYKVTLFDDLVISSTSSGGSFVINPGENATIDLNGHKLVFNVASGNIGKGHCLFVQNENSTLNVYSSKEDGVIYSTGSIVFSMKRSASTEIMEKAVLNVGAAANSDYSGNNLTVSGAVLFHVTSDSRNNGSNNYSDSTSLPLNNGQIDWERANEINIDGGTFHRHYAYTYAMFCASGPVKIDADNAFFLVTAGRFFSTDTRNWGEADGTFTNCDVIVKGNQLFKELQNTTKLVFEKCRVAGALIAFDDSIEAGTDFYKVMTEDSKTVYYFNKDNIPAGYTEITEGDLAAGQYIHITNSTNISPSNIADPDYESWHDDGRVVFTEGTVLYDSNALTQTQQVDWNGLGTGHILQSFSYDYSTYSVSDGALVAKAQNYSGNFDYLVTDTSSFVNNGIKVNISTNNGFVVNFYLPVGMAPLGVYADDGFTTALEVVAYNEQYNMVSVLCPAGSASSISVYIKFADESGTAFGQRIAISLSTYFNTVLENDATDAEKALIVNAANYCNELYKVAASKPDGLAAYNKIVTDNSDLIIAPDSLTSEQENILPEAVTGATFIIGEGNIPMFAFTVAGESTVTASYKKLDGEIATVTLEKYEQTTGEGEEAVTVVYYVIKEMAVYDMIGEITVYANGEKALVYSINDYINNTDNTVAKALWGYANAAIAYKTQK